MRNEGRDGGGSNTSGDGVDWDGEEREWGNDGGDAGGGDRVKWDGGEEEQRSGGGDGDGEVAAALVTAPEEWTISIPFGIIPLVEYNPFSGHSPPPPPSL